MCPKNVFHKQGKVKSTFTADYSPLGLAALVVVALFAYKPAPSKAAELIGYWAFKAGDMIADDLSPYNNDGILNGNAEIVDGPGNVAPGAFRNRPGSLSLDFTTDTFATMDYIEAYNFNSSGVGFSVAAWIKTTNTARQDIVGQGDTQGAGQHWEMYVSGGTLDGFLDADPPTQGASNPPTIINDGEWHHVAMTVDFSNGQWILYVDSANPTITNISGFTGNVSQADNPLSIGVRGSNTSPLFDGLIDDVRLYSGVINEAEILKLFTGAFGTAEDPEPTNGAPDIPRDGVILSWKPGLYASTHNVYFGTVFNDVNLADTANPLSASVIEGWDVNSLSLDRLDFSTTYYWRVDEVNDIYPDSPWKGDVWSFTIEPEAIPVVDISVTASNADSGKGAEKTIDGSGLSASGQHSTLGTDMWQTTITDNMPQPQIQYAFDMPYKLHQLHVWNHNGQYEKLLGYGIKEALIEYSLDGQTWTEFETVELAQATSQANYTGEDIPLNEIVAQFVRITANSNWSQNKYRTYGLSEVRFEAIPTSARELSPADGTVVSGIEVTFDWRNGRQAAEHQVYLDVNENLDLVQTSAPASLATTFAAQGSYDNYTASGLDLAQTYVWKVVEVNEAQTPSTFTSPIQGFTTPDYMVLDDMESYDNLASLPWMTWADGYEVAGNGSTVGADPAINDYSPETGVVHSGSQSLPIWIDNTTTALYSEATRTFDPSENWTKFRITTLSLFVRKGDLDMGGSLYVKINNNKVPLVDSGPYPAGFDPGWVQYAVDLTAMNVSSVTSLVVGVEGAGAMGVIYVDDIRLYAGSPELTTLTLIGSVIEAESGVLTGPFEIRDDPNASGGQYIIVPNGSIPNSNDKPVSYGNGWAVYTLDIPADGDYVIAFLGLNEVAGDNDDSFWVNIPGAIHNDAVQHPEGLGWLQNNNIFDGPQDSIVWDLVRDDYDDVTDPVVFTLTAGPHELQISHREDGTGLDAIAILAVNRN
jgi:hypothetical protein